jgi:hypothetical protein
MQEADPSLDSTTWVVLWVMTGIVWGILAAAPIVLTILKLKKEKEARKHRKRIDALD